MATYYIHTLTTKFDNSYKNVKVFAPSNSGEILSQREVYFKLGTLFSNEQPINFDFGDGLFTRVTYDYPGDERLSDLINHNYAIVKEVIDNQSKYYYYFINKMTYNALGQFDLDLELDVMQTYGLDSKLLDCYIDRAHVHRFTNKNLAGQNKYYYNIYGDEVTPLKLEKYVNYFAPEDTPQDTSKRLMYRKRIDFIVDTIRDSALNQWLNDNVKCWCYLFIKTGKTKIAKLDHTTEDVNFKPTKYLESAMLDNGMNTATAVFCYPIYLTNKTIKYNYDGGIFTLSYRAYNYYKELNNDGANLFAMRLSVLPPYELRYYQQGTDYTIDSDGNLVFLRAGAINKLPVNFDTHTASNFSFIYLEEIYTRTHTSKSISLHYATYDDNAWYEPKFEFTIGDIVAKSPNLIPRIFNNNATELKIRVPNGNSFSYNLLMLNQMDNLQFLYSESLTPDISKAYLRLDQTINKMFTTPYTRYLSIYARTPEDLNKNLFGLVSSDDTTLPVENSYLGEVLANQKNYFMQQKLGIGSNILQGITGGALAGMSGGSIGSIVGGLISGGISIGTSIANFELNKQNMEYAPDIVTNASGNSIFNELCADDFGCYVELYQALPQAFEYLRNYHNLLGYKIGHYIDTTQTFDYDSGTLTLFARYGRRRWNYIKGDFANIDNMNNKLIEDKIRNIFNQGTTLWTCALAETYDNDTTMLHRYDINGDYKNYERIINDEQNEEFNAREYDK